MITSDFHIVTLSWLYACCILLRRNFFSLILFETKVFTEMWDNCQVLNIMKRQPKKIVYGSMIGVCGCALCIAQKIYKWANKFTRQHHWNIRNGTTFAYSDFERNSNPPNWCQINFKIASTSVSTTTENKMDSKLICCHQNIQMEFCFKTNNIMQMPMLFYLMNFESIHRIYSNYWKVAATNAWKCAMIACIYTCVNIFDGVTCCQHTNRWSGRMVPSKNYVHFSYSLENFHTNLNRICIIEMHFIDHGCRECMIADGEGVINSKLI